MNLKWVQTKGIYLVLLLGFFLRVFRLNERGLWYDEAFAILYAARPLKDIVQGTLADVHGALADVHPLFYYFSVHFWTKIAGDSVFAARFLSVFWGVATLPLAYRVAKGLFGRRTSLAAIGVLAVAPFHVAYSQEARMYAQLAFWSTLALYAFVRYANTFRRRWWATFVCAGALALYTHNLGFLMFAVLGLWVTTKSLSDRSLRLFVPTALAGVAMFVLWLPWLVLIPGQFAKVEQAYWVPTPSWVTLVQTLLVFGFGFDNASIPAALLPVLLFGALLALVLIVYRVFKECQAIAWREKNGAWTLFVLAMAFLPIVLLYALSLWRPVYIIRALLPAFICYAILVAWAVVGLPKPVAVGVAALLGAIVIATWPNYYWYNSFPRSPFQEAELWLESHTQSADAIVHDNKLSFFPMHYYGNGLSETFVADPAGAGSDTLALPTQQALGLYATSLPAATAGKSRIWFVILQNAETEAADRGQLQSNLAWMDKAFYRVSVQRFNDLDVYLYER